MVRPSTPNAAGPALLPVKDRPAPRRGRGAAIAAAIAAIAAVALAAGGCSVLFMQAAPPEPMWQRLPDAPCTQSRFWPIVDVLMAVGQLSQAAGPSAFTDETSLISSESLVAAGLGVAIWGASAAVGFSRAARCDQYRLVAGQQRWQAPPDGAPGSGPPAGWAPPAQRPAPTVPPPGQPDDPGDAPPPPEAFGPTAPPQAPPPQSSPSPPPSGGSPGSGAAPTPGDAEPPPVAAPEPPVAPPPGGTR